MINQLDCFYLFPNEFKRVIQQLANRVNTLEERYVEPLPALTLSVGLLSDNVDEHLKKVGLQW